MNEYNKNMKFNDIDYFLNECKKCNLKFDNAKQLLSHVNNFCLDSNVNFDNNKLEKKFNDNINIINENNKNEDLMEVFKIKENDDYKTLINKIRDMEINEEMENIRKERNKIKLEKIDEEGKYTKALEIFEKNKREEITAYIEKQKIKKNLKKLEKEKLEILENEKKIELEKIERKKQQLVDMEKNIKLEVKRMHLEINEINQIYKNEENKINKLGDDIKKYNDNNINYKHIYKDHYENKVERVANLRAKRLELENKKIMINKQIEENKLIKNFGDFRYKNLGLINFELNPKLIKANKNRDSLDQLVDDNKINSNKTLNIDNMKNEIQRSLKENEELKNEIYRIKSDY